MEASHGRHSPPAAGKSSRRNKCSKLRWVMLDRSIHLTGGGLVDRDGIADRTLSEISSTCTDTPIAASLTVAEPPAASRLHLHWPEGSRPELRNLREPSVIAANGDSILFEVRVPLSAGLPEHYPVDYFVYTASRSDQKPPSLTLLPLCDIGGREHPVMDQYFVPYRHQQQRPMWSGEMGLLCRGSGRFTVAELKYGGELCVLHHAPGQDESGWELQKVQMPGREGTPNLLFGSWKTDAVVSLGGRYLCWVDCYLGLMFVDVLDDEHTKLPRFVPLPDALDSDRTHIDRAELDPARHVCVVGTAVVKLVSICDDDDTCRCACYCGKRPQLSRAWSNFTIRIWALASFKKMRWENVAVMHGTDVSAAHGSDERLLRPQFPLLSLSDPDVIYFQLDEKLVEVDVKKKEVLGAVTICRNDWQAVWIIPSQFTRYLTEHQIRSLEVTKQVREAQIGI